MRSGVGGPSNDSERSGLKHLERVEVLSAGGCPNFTSILEYWSEERFEDCEEGGAVVFPRGVHQAFEDVDASFSSGTNF